MASVAEVLEKAADLIEPKGAWTTEYEARDADGYEVGVDDDGAVCWCIGGAIWHVARAGTERPTADFLERVLGESIPSWNDASERTQAEVVAKLREAAQLAREQAA